MSTFSYNYSSIIFIKGSTSLGFPLQVQLRLDTLSFLFLTLVTFLIPILLLISIKNIKKNIKFYFLVLLGFEVILIFTFLSFLIFLFFFSFEIILTLMSFSLSQWGSKLYKIRSTFYLFLFTIFHCNRIRTYESSIQIMNRLGSLNLESSCFNHLHIQ